MFKVFKNLFLCLFAAMLVCFSGMSVYAQTIVDQLKTPIPEFNTLSEDAFFEETVPYQEVPSEDKFLEYSVRLPKNWKKPGNSGIGGFSLSNKVLGEFARYFGPPRLGERSYFSVQALEIDYQLSAEQWFAQYVLENGYALQGLKTINQDRVEALYVLVRGDITFVVRAAALINGKRVVLAQHVVPADAFEAERALQQKVVESFKLISPDTSFVEEMKIHKFVDIAEFYYPVSWDVRPEPVKTIDRMRADLYRSTSRWRGDFDVIQLLDGQIGVDIISGFVAEELEVEIENFRNGLEEKGLLIKEVIEKPEDFVFREDIDFGYVEVSPVVDEEGKLLDYEFWITVMASGDYYYFVSLLTPSREHDFTNWARNTQTLRVISQLVGAQTNEI